jgi:hypothetical protein
VSQLLVFLLGALAVWKVPSLLCNSAGPLHVFDRLRHIAGDGFCGRLLGSHLLLKMWIAAGVAAWLDPGPEWGLIWLALAGSACLLEELCRRRLERSGPILP